MKILQNVGIAIGLLGTVGIIASGTIDNTDKGQLAAGFETNKSYFRSIGYFESGTYLYDALAHPAMLSARKDACGWGTALRAVPCLELRSS